MLGESSETFYLFIPRTQIGLVIRLAAVSLALELVQGNSER
jgi:hypothetical protein